jgi:DNA-binding response OmpR family regulator
VEDDRALRAALTFAFEAEGYRVKPYARAAEVVLAAPSTLAADCLIIDYRLPGMGGLGLLAALRERAITTPAILITSNLDERRRRRALALDAEIIEKPLVTDELHHRVRQIVG